MSQQQQIQTQELSASQILRVYGKQFTQITEQYAGMSFDGIADYLDQLHELTPNDLVEY